MNVISVIVGKFSNIHRKSSVSKTLDKYADRSMGFYTTKDRELLQELFELGDWTKNPTERSRRMVRSLLKEVFFFTPDDYIENCLDNSYYPEDTMADELMDTNNPSLRRKVLLKHDYDKYHTPMELSKIISEFPYVPLNENERKQRCRIAPSIIRPRGYYRQQQGFMEPFKTIRDEYVFKIMADNSRLTRKDAELLYKLLECAAESDHNKFEKELPRILSCPMRKDDAIIGIINTHRTIYLKRQLAVNRLQYPTLPDDLVRQESYRFLGYYFFVMIDGNFDFYYLLRDKMNGPVLRYS